MTRSLALAVFLFATPLAACDRPSADEARHIADGDPERGRLALRSYGCGSCHTIPGVPSATATVGPSLEHVALRRYVAGILPNTPENLAAWIAHPRSFARTAMPELGVGENDARDMVAFLYTLD